MTYQNHIQRINASAARRTATVEAENELRKYTRRFNCLLNRIQKSAKSLTNMQFVNFVYKTNGVQVFVQVLNFNGHTTAYINGRTFLLLEDSVDYAIVNTQ